MHSAVESDLAPAEVEASSSRRPWWREPAYGLVVLLWAGLYTTQLGRPPLRGEETRRAQIAQEMIQTGDVVVPRQQGLIFADRPPLFEWTIAATGVVVGDLTASTVRIPSALAALLAAATIMVYCSRFLSAHGTAAAAIVFLTFGQITQFGRSAESEAVNIAWLTLALLGWHACYQHRSVSWRAWSLGYFFAALSGLTKGPQGPIYFAAAVGAYLMIRRDWRFLVSWGHVVGMGLFAIVFGGWWWAFRDATDPISARTILFGLIEGRVLSDGSRLQHALIMPLMVLGGLLPWSPLLLRYLDRRFRHELGTARDAVVFCATAVVVTFPTICFVLNSMSRHFLGLSGCFAVLCGVVVDRSLVAGWSTSLGRGWTLYIRSLGVTAAVGGVVVMGAGFIDARWADTIAQPWSFAVMFLLAAFATAGIAWKSTGVSATSSAARRRFAAVACLAAFVALTQVGVYTSGVDRLANDTAAQTAAVKAALPVGASLVSFDPIDHVFLFHYADAIPVLPWPDDAQPMQRNVEYFAFAPAYTSSTPPFAWEEVAVVTCDRTPQTNSQRKVIIGRRTDGVMQATAPPALRR